VRACHISRSLGDPMRLGLACLAVSCGIAAIWLAWPAVVMPQAPLKQRKAILPVLCAVPGHADPFDPTTFIPAAQIEETCCWPADDCVRIYSADQGLEQVAGIAAKFGLKFCRVFGYQTISQEPVQLETTCLGNRYPVRSCDRRQ